MSLATASPGSRNELQQQAGFTLIECLACIVILGTTIIAGISLSSVQSVAVASDEMRVLATRLLQREFEIVQATRYEAIDDVGFEAVEGDPRFSRRIKVSESSHTTKKVSIEIEWDSLHGVTQRISLDTLRSRYKL